MAIERPLLGGRAAASNDRFWGTKLPCGAWRIEELLLESRKIADARCVHPFKWMDFR